MKFTANISTNSEECLPYKANASSFNWNFVFFSEIPPKINKNQIMSAISFSRGNWEFSMNDGKASLMRFMLVDDQMWVKIEWTMTTLSEGRPNFFFSLVLISTQIRKMLEGLTLCSYPVMGGILHENYREKETEKMIKISQMNCKLLEIRTIWSINCSSIFRPSNQNFMPESLHILNTLRVILTSIASTQWKSPDKSDNEK